MAERLATATRPVACQTRSPHPRVERRAQLLHESIEAGRVQDLVQALIERMTGALRQVRRCHPHRLLGPVVAGCPIAIPASVGHGIGRVDPPLNGLSPRPANDLTRIEANAV